MVICNTMMEGKLAPGTSKIKKSQSWLVEVALYKCITCLPARCYIFFRYWSNANEAVEKLPTFARVRKGGEERALVGGREGGREGGEGREIEGGKKKNLKHVR